jgi:hypothetical protein
MAGRIRVALLIAVLALAAAIGIGVYFGLTEENPPGGSIEEEPRRTLATSNLALLLIAR